MRTGPSAVVIPGTSDGIARAGVLETAGAAASRLAVAAAVPVPAALAWRRACAAAPSRRAA
jgi:hypothetical protein